MRKNVVVTLAGFGLIAGAGIARAANPPVVTCTPAAFEVCAAVSAAATWNGSTGTVTLTAWNLFGNAGYPGALSSVFTYVGIGSPSFTGTATLTSALYNSVSVMAPTASKGWVGGVNTNQAGNIGATLDFASSPTGNKYGLIGCNQTADNNSNQLQTCYSNANKALVLVWSVNKQFSLDGAVWEVHAQEINQGDCSLWLGSNGNSTGGTTSTGGSCGGTTVTPEPITMTLLGTGLFGMGGFGFLRRRRKDSDIES